MSIIITTIQATFAPALGISLLKAFHIVVSGLALAGMLIVFKPLLIGIMKASILLVKPRLSKEQRLERRQMRDAKMLSSMINSMDSMAPSHAAELRALASHA